MFGAVSDLDADPPALVRSPLDRLVDAPALRTSGNGAAMTPPRLTRRGRLRKWDRPKPPKDWRFWIGGVGKTLIAVGLLMFGFVAYQLWGTGIETARAQNALENEFEALLADAPPVTAPAISAGGSSVIEPDIAPVDGEPAADPEPAPGDDADDVSAPVTTAAPVPVEEQNLPELEEGDALARIEIPAIGVSDIVVAGVSKGDLKKGPGHFPDTPLPGQLGNSAIAGHRTTYGAPFHDVDDLDVGDEMIVTTLSGTFTYEVTGSAIVGPGDYQVIATTDATKATMTLVSCHPKWTSKQRIVIFGELVPETSAPVGEPVINYGRPIRVAPAADRLLPVEGGGDEAIDESGQLDASSNGSVTGNLVDDDPSGVDQLGSEAVNENIADAFSEGWFSDPGANLQVGLWGLVVSLVAIGAYLVSRRFRRDWAGALVGIVPFAVALYFFFQNVNRLLPPNL